MLLPVLAVLARSHGVMQLPPPWQLGNFQPAVAKSCVSGGCNWFTNATFLRTPPSIAQGSPLRTFADVGSNDWTARNPWRAPGTAAVFSPCGTEGGNPLGCVRTGGNASDARDRVPCSTDDGGFGFGADGRSLGGSGITTSWVQGAVVEVGFSLRSNHGGGYSYRLCRVPASGNYGELTEACFAQTPLDFVGATSRVVYHDSSVGSFEIDAVRTRDGTFPPGSQWTRNPIPSFGRVSDSRATALPQPRSARARTRTHFSRSHTRARTPALTRTTACLHVSSTCRRARRCRAMVRNSRYPR